MADILRFHSFESMDLNIFDAYQLFIQCDKQAGV